MKHQNKISSSAVPTGTSNVRNPYFIYHIYQPSAKANTTFLSHFRVCLCVFTEGGVRGIGERDNCSECQRVTSLVRSLNFQVPRNTWLGVNNWWSNISYYYCKCYVTAGWGSRGQIPHQIINASCRAKPESGGGSEDEKEGGS